MDFGIFIFATDESPSPAALACEVEARGFDLLLFPEHTHIPVARTMLGPAGGELAREHRRSLDPFVACTMAAAVTTSLRVGTGICLVAQRDPVILAKTVASLDHVSGGRFVFGIGFGWNQHEIATHGIDPSVRHAIAAEKVGAMKEIWTSERATWTGDHVAFGPLYSWPKPVQKPHPPILVGGSPTAAVLSAVVDYANGWMPYAYFHDVARGVERLAAMAEKAGRDPASLELAVMGTRADPAVVASYRDLGARRVIFDLPVGDWDQLRRRLDRCALLIDRDRSGGS